MKRALIATLFNEADNVSRWWDCLMGQTVLPDEIIIVDGGSTDGTWEKLQSLANQSRTPVKLEQRRCNIATGRNRAIALTDAEIIAATDAGSFPEREWFHEITRPLLEDKTLDVTGGLNISNDVTPFQQFLAQLEAREETGVTNGEIHPSSRNTAFRRQAWADVGGYPEWLTLAGEDALFTHELNKIGKKFFYNPRAIVHWTLRETAADYFKLLYRNGYGAAEARLYAPYFRQRAILTLFPPLLLLSRHRFRHLKYRYLKNYSSARGWLDGRRAGHRPPADWKRVDGIWLSPEAQQKLFRRKND
jgi:glycosyltransferase involved in cell wall biosynthesis